MGMETLIVGESKNETLNDTKTVFTRYAWGNSNLKTWFITKNRKSLLPIGSKLLFVLTCEIVIGEVKTSDTYPSIGDIIFDVDGSLIKVIDIKWYN